VPLHAIEPALPGWRATTTGKPQPGRTVDPRNMAYTAPRSVDKLLQATGAQKGGAWSGNSRRGNADPQLRAERRRAAKVSHACWAARRTTASGRSGPATSSEFSGTALPAGLNAPKNAAGDEVPARCSG
jgi:hypothetical protein